MERCIKKHIDKYCETLSIADACIFRRLLDWIPTLSKGDIPGIELLLELKMLDLIRETYNGTEPDEDDKFIQEEYRTEFICDFITTYNKLKW